MKLRYLIVLAGLALFVTWACTDPVTEPPPIDDVDTDPDGTDNPDDTSDGAITVEDGTISGSITKIGTSSFLEVTDSSIKGGMIVVQNTENGAVYQGPIANDGSFTITVPSLLSKSGTFVVSVVSQTGKPLGTLTQKSGTSSSYSAGLVVTGGAKLGITLPTALGGPISTELDGVSSFDSALTVPTNSDGVISSLASFGKVNAAIPSLNSRVVTNLADPDADGLPSVLDADDDGDGIVDELDTDADAKNAGNSRVKISFGYLLDLENEQVLDYLPVLPASYGSPSVQYSYVNEVGITAARRLAIGLTRDMRLDIWVQPEDGVQIKSVKLLTESMPEYMSKLYTGPQQPPRRKWSEPTMEGAYNLGPVPDQMASGANADRKVDLSFHDGNDDFSDITESSPQFSVGDTLTFRIEEEDGSIYYISKMINYTFKRPFFFKKYGAAGESSIDWSPSYDGVQNKFIIDRTKDLEIVLSSPLDERDLPITSGATFELVMNYVSASGDVSNIDYGAFLNDNGISSSPVSSTVAWEGRRVRIPQSKLEFIAGSSTGDFTIRIPKELLFSTMVDQSGTNHTITSYRIGANFIVGTIGSWDVSTIENRIRLEPLP